VAKKSGGKSLKVKNLEVQKFLVDLAVDDAFRQRYADADDPGKDAILDTEFKIGKKSRKALVEGTRKTVMSRLAASDQQGTPAPKGKAAKPKKRARKR
jgi:hypothetical protein